MLTFTVLCPYVCAWICFEFVMCDLLFSFPGVFLIICLLDKIILRRCSCYYICNKQLIYSYKMEFLQIFIAWKQKCYFCWKKYTIYLLRLSYIRIFGFSLLLHLYSTSFCNLWRLTIQNEWCESCFLPFLLLKWNRDTLNEYQIIKNRMSKPYMSRAAVVVNEKYGKVHF